MATSSVSTCWNGMAHHGGSEPTGLLCTAQPSSSGVSPAWHRVGGYPLHLVWWRSSRPSPGSIPSHTVLTLLRISSCVRFHTMSIMIAVDILGCTGSMEERAALLHKTIQLAAELKSTMGNMFSFAAVMNALEMTQV